MSQDHHRPLRGGGIHTHPAVPPAEGKECMDKTSKRKRQDKFHSSTGRQRMRNNNSSVEVEEGVVLSDDIFRPAEHLITKVIYLFRVDAVDDRIMFLSYSFFNDMKNNLLMHIHYLLFLKLTTHFIFLCISVLLLPVSFLRFVIYVKTKKKEKKK